MTIEVALLLSFISVSFAVYSGLKNLKKADASEIERRASEQAKVNVKLDNIATDCREIKSDMSSVKKDVQELSERLVVVEQSVKSAHHRIDTVERLKDPEDRK